MAADDGQTTRRWTFAEYNRVNDRWVPGSVELREYNAEQKLVWRDQYTRITAAPALAPSELRKVFAPPTAEYGDPDFDHLTSVFTFSEEGETFRAFRY